MANGVVLKGTVVKSSEVGLDVQTATGVRTVPWETLAPSTRYRYESVFRANYESVLDGLPTSARTNEPDQEVEQIVTNAPATEISQPAQPSSSSDPESLGLIEQLSYAQAGSFFSKSFPTSEISSPEMALFCGFQYGPAQSDIVYLAFDARGAKDVLDTMVVYTPSNAAYSTPQRITGFKKTSADAKIVTFKKIPLITQVGDVAVSYEMECVSLMYMNEVNVNFLIQLTAGDTKARFNLTGTLKDFAQGQELVADKGILDEPILRINVSSDPKNLYLAGTLTMSGLKLIPREGMSNRLNIEVISGQGEVVQKESIKLEDAPLSDIPNFLCNLKKVQPSQTYTVKASIDLTPFLETVSFEDTITIPKS
jgi:hypothetical protein